MPDPNQVNFHDRLGRIGDIRSSGGGFEAEGALGMRHYNSGGRKRRRSRLLGILIMTTAVVVFLKATTQVTLGPSLYADKVAMLEKGSQADRAGAFIMRPDPVSSWLAAILDRYVRIAR